MAWKTVVVNLLVAFLCVDSSTTSSRILFLLPYASKSHLNFYRPIIRTLGERNHEVTLLTPFQTFENTTNVKEIVVKFTHDETTRKLPDWFEARGSQSFFSLFPLTWRELVVSRGHQMHSDPEVQKMTKLPPGHFDLVVVNGVFGEITYGLVHHLQSPWMLVMTTRAFPWMHGLLGGPSLPSHVPNFFLQLPSRMSFWQRLKNTLAYHGVTIFRHYYFLPPLEQMVKKYFPYSPAFSEVESTVGMVMVNSHFSLSHAQPTLPAFVEVAGTHCHDPKPLPKDLEDWVQGGAGDHGFIYFSLGSFIPGSKMPQKYRRAFLDAFARLPQRVLWKWEEDGGALEKLPPNVRISKWLPQQDLLGHPKIRAFITQGGIMSLQEAIYHGVPVIGIPFFGDQDINMSQAEEDGYGILLELSEISADVVYESLNKLINTSSYQEKIKQLSFVFRDQQVSPVNQAVFWMEYMVRHKGATHLRTSSADLYWFQYYLLDVYLFMAFIALFVVLIFVMAIPLLRGKKSQKNTKKCN